MNPAVNLMFGNPRAKPLVLGAADPKPAEDSQTVLESFLPEYQELIYLLPAEFHPTSTRHGQHSFTTWLNKNVSTDIKGVQRGVCIYIYRDIKSLQLQMMISSNLMGVASLYIYIFIFIIYTYIYICICIYIYL